MNSIHDTLLGSPLFCIAGPCAIENRETTFIIAEKLVHICSTLEVPLIFKGSYRKANRTKLDSFQGIGDETALGILKEIRDSLKIPVITDIHTPDEAEYAAQYVSALQIPAFLCRQTDLLLAAGKTGLPVNIKKGQFMSANSMQHAVEKINSVANTHVMLTERGNSFGYGDLIVDMTNIPKMKRYPARVIMDCTHSLQQPNQSSGVTGGDPTMIATIANAAVAAGADGLFIETHPDPSAALSDGANMLPLHEFESIIKRCLHIRKAIAL